MVSPSASVDGVSTVQTRSWLISGSAGSMPHRRRAVQHRDDLEPLAHSVSSVRVATTYTSSSRSKCVTPSRVSLAPVTATPFTNHAVQVAGLLGVRNPKAESVSFVTEPGRWSPRGPRARR